MLVGVEDPEAHRIRAPVPLNLWLDIYQLSPELVIAIVVGAIMAQRSVIVIGEIAAALRSLGCQSVRGRTLRSSGSIAERTSDFEADSASSPAIEAYLRVAGRRGFKRI
jgi:hypothetical protein